MRFLKTNITILTIILFCSCARTLTITNSSGKKVGGIPFYTKKAVIEQQTKYVYSWKILTLVREEKKDDKLISTNEIQRRIKNNESLDKLDGLLDLLNKSKNENEELKNVIAEIKSFDKVDLNNISSANLIDNNWKYLTTVDYSNKYYLNSKIPWFGTSTLSQELASDGTLSKASGTTDSQIDELAGVVAGLATPLASVKVAEIEKDIQISQQQIDNVEAYIKEQPFTVSEPLRKQYFENRFFKTPENPVVYKLKVEEKGYVYTFKAIHEISDLDKANEEIKFRLTNSNYTRANWPQTKKAEPKKEDKPTINLSGTIQLPKEK